jgi:hypothetical protein
MEFCVKTRCPVVSSPVPDAVDVFSRMYFLIRLSVLFLPSHSVLSSNTDDIADPCK